MTIEKDSNATATPVAAAAATPPALSEKLAPFRKLLGMPVAVQFAVQTPYIQIAPLIDKGGNVQTARIPATGEVIGLPAIVEPLAQTHVAVGTLHASECGTWLVIEENLGIPRTAESLGGRALMDVYVRPEMVTHVSFVKQVELTRRHTDA